MVLGLNKCCGIKVRKWTIRKQIMYGILGVSGTLLFTLALASILNIIVLGNKTSTEATSALESTIRANMINFAVSNAKQVQQTLERRAAVATTLAHALRYMLDAPLLAPGQSVWDSDIDQGMVDDGKATELIFVSGVQVYEAVPDLTPPADAYYGTSYYLPKVHKTNDPQTGSANPEVDCVYHGYCSTSTKAIKCSADNQCPGAATCDGFGGPNSDEGVNLKTGACAPLDDVLAKECWPDTGRVGGDCATAVQRVKDSTPSGQSTLPMTTADIRDRASLLDPYMHEFGSKMKDISLMYVGFEQSGMFRQYKGDNYFDTHKVDGVGKVAGFPERTYDPRKRGWYIAAKAAARTASGRGFGQVIVTEPYIGAGKNVWMITIAQAVYDLHDDGVLRAVVGVDIEITDIQDAILRVHFLKRGYVALTESTARSGKANDAHRIVIAHPTFEDAKGHEKVDAALPDIAAVEPDLVANTTLFATALGSTSGVADYGDNGDGGATHLLAHAPVTAPGKYTVLIFVPTEEALEAVPPLDAKLRKTKTTVTLAVVLISIVTGVVVFFIVGVVADHVSQPVVSMVSVANAIVSGAAERDMAKGVKAGGEMDALRKFADDAGPGDGGEGGNQGSGNEMVQLVRSFLVMASGLKKDSDRSKQRVLQPTNPFHVSHEHPLVDSLQGANTTAWPRGNVRSGERPESR